jgi:hypothetical protein
MQVINGEQSEVSGSIMEKQALEIANSRDNNPYRRTWALRVLAESVEESRAILRPS